MFMQNINDLKDEQLCKLIDNRWASSDSLWDIIEKTYNANTAIYENNAEWVKQIPRKRLKVQANRIFVNMESVINTLIANPASINFIPTRKTEESIDLARKLERYFKEKIKGLNYKEILRMGLRNLYFSRLLVLKPFWNNSTNDFDVRAINPNKVRFGKYARNEKDSEFAIEQIEDNLQSVIDRFPDKKDEILKKVGIVDEADIAILNPEITYKECWIGDYLIFKYDTIILKKMRNPYWDWDGILMTEEEMARIDDEEDPLVDDSRRMFFSEIKGAQEDRKKQKQEQEQYEKQIKEGEMIEPNTNHSEPISLQAYHFNHFNQPRKPYIFATIFNNESQPIGRTDMITLAAPLQQSLDKRKRDIDYNAELVNGITKVDASVMDKSDAQQLRWDAGGIIWGKGVMGGVGRETGAALPSIVFDDMNDSRSEIDNIMAASSAFRGEREGQETKAGRLALIEQSFLRLNELVQVVDYVTAEMFNWSYQLAKTRYTEYHYAKWIGKDDAAKIMDIIQDDFENGSEIIVIPGKSLPQDSQFKFEQAQADVQAGIISPVDYFEIANYENPKDIARNAVLFKQNPAKAVGIEPEELPPAEQPGEPSIEQQAQEAQIMAQAQLPPEQLMSQQLPNQQF